MAVYNKFNSFVEALAEKQHDLQSDTLKVVFTNTAPTAAHTQLSNIVSPITIGSNNTLSVTSSEQTGGVYKLIVADLEMEATVAVGPLRYAVVYNDTSANKLLIGWYDYGSSVSLAAGDKLTFKPNETDKTLLSLTLS